MHALFHPLTIVCIFKFVDCRLVITRPPAKELLRPNCPVWVLCARVLKMTNLGVI